MAAKAHALIHGQVYVGCENVAAVALAGHAASHRGEFHRAERRNHRRTTSCGKSCEKIPQNRTAGLSPRTWLQHHGSDSDSRRSCSGSRSRSSRGANRSASWRGRWWRATAWASTARPSTASPSSSRSTANTPSATTPRHLDWKVLGRTDRYYIKQYEQDTNFVAQLLIDGSESMNYGSRQNHQAPVREGARAPASPTSFCSSATRWRCTLFDTEMRETCPARTTSARSITS